MAKKEQLIKDFVTFGLESEKNKQEAIDAACNVLVALNHIPTNKKLTKKELDLIAGGNLQAFDRRRTEVD